MSKRKVKRTILHNFIVGVTMEVKKTARDGAGKEGKERRFPKLKGMIDKLRVPVIATITAAVVTFGAMNCGNGTETQDGGHDAGTTTDAGADSDVTTDSGTDADAGPSLCEQYPDGHENRHTFELKVAEDVADCSGFSLMLADLEDIGDGELRARFSYSWNEYPVNPDFLYFELGEQLTHEVAETGPTKFELCHTTPDPCSHDGSGDQSCTATLASDRAFDCD